MTTLIYDKVSSMMQTDVFSSVFVPKDNILSI